MSQKMQSAQYDVFTAIRVRVSKNGLVMVPVAGPFPTPAVVMAIHGGLEFDFVSYTAVRRGDWPVVPAPYSSNPNRVYLDGGQTAAWPIDEVVGPSNYAVSGFFKFGILSPEGLEADFLLGTVPFPGADPDERFPSTYLSYTMLNQRQIRQIDGKSIPGLPTLLSNIIAKQAGGNG